MHFSRTRLKALESLLSWLVAFVVDKELFRLLAFFCDRLLATNEVDREAFWVRDGEHVAATRGIGNFVDVVQYRDVWNLLDPINLSKLSK